MSPPDPSLPDDAREALAKAALLDDPFCTQILLEAGSQPRALDPLFDLGLLEESGPGDACFASESTREAALKSLSWSQRRQLSESLAEACLKLAQEPALVARLFLGAHRHAAAREQFVRAADEAARRHAHREALALIRSALDIWPSGESPAERRRLLREMARCASACSERASARFAWSELWETADPDATPAERIDLKRRLAQAAADDGDRLQARILLAEAATLAQSSGLVPESAQLWRSLAQAQSNALRLAEALVSLESARAAANACGDWPLLCDAIADSAFLTAMLGRISEARALLDQALALAITRDLPEQITNAYRRQANVNEYASNYEAYRDTELAALDRCRARGEEGGVQACLTCVSYAFFRLGQYDESLAAIEEAVVELGAEGELYAGALTVRACLHAARGVGSDIMGDLDEARRLDRLHGAHVFEFYILWAKGAYATLQRQPDLARAAFEELIDFWRETDDRKDVAPGLLCAATLFAQENDASKLAVCLDILNTLQSTNESAEPRYAFLAASAEDAWRSGRAAEAVARFEEARAGYETLHLPFEEAWILWRIGFVQSQTGNAAESASAWRKADALVGRLGLKPLGRAIARDRRQGPSPSDSAAAVTPRQLEIARLLASGRTNKEAASELGISPRTVEMHVAALLERLGCRTRAEASKRAVELGLLR